MNTTIVVLGAFAGLSLLSSMLVLFALARSSQISRRDEKVEQKMRHGWEPGTQEATVLWSETAPTSNRLLSTPKRRDPSIAQDF